MHESIACSTRIDIPTGPAGAPLLLAKLDMPSLPATTLRRPRLLDRVTAGVCGRLTVVCAPAGSGKTTLMRSWTDDGLAPGPVVWITLDPLDRQPGIFWSYLLAGLARAGVATPGVAAPDHPYRLDTSFLTQLSAALYQRSDPVVVVLDDADTVAGSPLSGQLDFLIRNAGASLRLVLLTRDDPAVSLPRYRLAGSVTEIGPADLAATQAEAAALFERQGIPASAETLAAILRRTRGWMAGLVLTGLALRNPGQQSGASGGASPGSEDLDEYLDEEVLGTYPASVRRFLVRTSIADHLPAGLAEELAGQQNAARLLGQLARHNAFVTCCEEHVDCYRYHPLLLDTLRARLEEDSPGAGPRLHWRAAGWFLRAGEPTEAAVHAAAAQQWEAAAEMIVDGLGIAHLLSGPGSGRLTWQLADMPADVPGAKAAVVRATVALVRGDTSTCKIELAAARELARGAGAEPSTALTVSSSVVAGALAAATGHTEAAMTAAADVEKLLAQLPPSQSSATVRMLVLSYSARALLQAGRLEASLARLNDARRAGAPGADDVRATCDGLAALVEVMRGRVSRAVELTAADPGPTGDPAPAGMDNTLPAQIALAWVAADTGDMALARRRSAALIETDLQDPVLAAALAILRARVHRAEGNPTSALAVLAAGRRRPHGVALPDWLDARLAAEAAATWTASGRPDCALRTLTEHGTPAGAEVALELARAEFAAPTAKSVSDVIAELLRHVDLPLGVRVDALLLRATEALERGDTATAETAVDRALRAAAPERLRRPFLEAPARVRAFVRQQSELTAAHRWLDQAEPPPRPPLPARPLSVAPKAAPTVLIEPLTEKEREVLVHLAELLSTEEIARQMYVSVNTIRTHVQAILRKLAASRRNEAIRRARELGLI
jgi:LuxR family maltose regulon positive regulatory protein